MSKRCSRPSATTTTTTTSTRLFSSASQTNPSQQSTGVTFRYSPTFLQHLQAIELPSNDKKNGRSWTPTKIKAMTGALVLGTVAAVVGENIMMLLLDVDKTFPLFAAVGAASGWFLLGGEQIRLDELPMNGGYDAKFVADRPIRLQTLLNELPANSITCTSSTTRNMTTTTTTTHQQQQRDMAQLQQYIQKVHGTEYPRLLESKSRQCDRPKRLNPTLARTLIDEYSYDAAVEAVSVWMDSVDNAAAATTTTKRPIFGLVRPPSHHACREKGMGGCLFNSISIAAMYALDLPGIQTVAILDVDAHHGNGIAHCIQDMPQIKYCSIHDEASVSSTSSQHYMMMPQKISLDDPRGPSSDDVGPLGNICNINLSPKTGWTTGYKDAVERVAMPFLLSDPKPDILLVAAGFDALQADSTSSLTLQPRDFRELGKILHDAFGNRVAFGLEGGYCWQNGELSLAIMEFVSPWQDEVETF